MSDDYDYRDMLEAKGAVKTPFDDHVNAFVSGGIGGVIGYNIGKLVRSELVGTIIGTGAGIFVSKMLEDSTQDKPNNQ